MKISKEEDENYIKELEEKIAGYKEYTEELEDKNKKYKEKIKSHKEINSLK